MNFSPGWFRSWSCNFYTNSFDKSGPIWIHGRLLMRLWTIHPKISCRTLTIVLGFVSGKSSHISFESSHPTAYKKLQTRDSSCFLVVWRFLVGPQRELVTGLECHCSQQHLEELLPMGIPRNAVFLPTSLRVEADIAWFGNTGILNCICI